MKFNLFSFVNFVCVNINFSLSPVQRTRFQLERWMARKEMILRRRERDDMGEHSQNFFQSGSNAYSTNYSNDNLRRFEERRSIIGWFRKEVLWLFSYEQYGVINLILITGHFLFILYVLFCATLHTIYPIDRDPVTYEFKNPVLRYMESIYLVDFTHHFDPSKMLVRYSVVIMTRFAMLRAISIYSVFKATYANRYKYKNFNLVQFNVASACNLSASLRDWIRLAIHCYKHDCNEHIEESHRENEAMRKLFQKLKNGSRIDYLYYYNIITFESCYNVDLDIYKEKNNLVSRKDEINSDITSYEFIEEAIAETSEQRRKELEEIKRINPIQKFFTFYTHAYNMHNPHPFWRVSPKDFFICLVVNVFSLLAIGVINIAIVLITMVVSLLEHGFEWRNASSTFIPAVNSICSRQRLLFSIIEGNLFTILIALNTFDNGLLIYNAMFLRSRSTKVNRMLSDKLKFLDKCVKDFDIYIDDNFYSSTDRQDSLGECLFETKPNSTEIGFSKRKFHNTARKRIDKLVAKKNVQRAKFKYDYDIDDVGDSDDFDQRNDIKWLQRHSVLSKFRSIVGKAVVTQFNDDIDHLLDLIGIVHSEFVELRNFFSRSLNINVIFGTLTSAIIYTIITRTDSYNLMLISIIALFASSIDLSFSLIMGAVSERGFKQICVNLNRLQVNKFHFLNRDVTKKVLRICDHLSHNESRSFMLIELIPLTFGSLTSIAAWIVTSIAFIQKFI